MNKRNYKNPAVRAWEELRLTLAQFTDRMQRFDDMVQRQGRDIGVDEVYNEIQNIRGELNKIENSLNLYNNTINNERMVDKSQTETPLEINGQQTNEHRTMNEKNTIRLNEVQLKRVVAEAVKRVLKEGMSDKHFPISNGHPDIYTSFRRNGNKYKLQYGADYGYKKDSSLLKHGELNPNAKRTEWMWIHDMVNHANDLFSEYHLYDEDAYEAIEKLHELLKQGVSESDAVDQIGDTFYQDN